VYCGFFGFSEKPFDVTMNPKFLYLNSQHRETLAVLISAIGERHGLITIEGDLGTGKTTLLKTVLGKLNEKTKVAYISNTTMTFEEMLAMTLVDLGIAKLDESLSKVEASHRLNDFAIRQLARGGNVVVIVDEAQNLNGSAMKKLQLLSNQETRKHKLIQVVLCGLPELHNNLKQLEVSPLDDLPTVKQRITPLNEKETYEYIQHHLDVADYTAPALFTRKAQRLVWEHSRGVPRNINTLCNNALLTAYALRERKIKAGVVRKAIGDLCWKSPFLSGYSQATLPLEECDPQLKHSISHARFALAGSIMLAVCVFFVTGLLVANYRLKVESADPLLGHPTIRVGSPGQSNGPHKPWALGQQIAHRQTSMFPLVALARLSDEKIKDNMDAVRPHIYDHRKSAGVLLETKKSESSVNTEAAYGEKNEFPDGNTRQVSSKKKTETTLEYSIFPKERPDEKATGAAACVPDLKKDAAEVGNVVIQVGSFREGATAERLVRLLKAKGYDVYLEIRTLKNLGLFHRVRVRGYASVAAARTEIPRLRKQGFNDAFISSL
jgi:type II secretory pathway predicted ATPase ExeA/cell division protein FtsN